MRIFATVLLFCLFSSMGLAVTPADEISFLKDQTRFVANQEILLAGASQDKKDEPESGSLIIPGEDQSREKKKCLNVCKKWGEDCIINPRTGSRNCRRTCKQFGEDCF